MRRYFVRRLLLFVPTLILASMMVFTLMWIVPGDAAMMILTGEGESGRVKPEDLERLRHDLGLDRPFYIQYGDWLAHVVVGDLGDSIWYKIPVIDELKARFPVTLQLAVMAMLMATIAAVPLGILSAVTQDSWIDYGCRVFTLVGVALPFFWTGILMVYALAYFFGWLPPLGYATLWEDPLTNLQQLVFPALALAFYEMAFTARVTRSAMLEVMREDYIRTARSKGIRENRVIARHALKNAILPIITISGYQFGRLLGGVIIIEVIFVVPGMGTLLINSIVHRDFVMIQGMILMVAAVILILNLVIDLLYGILDPRIRYQ
jgi:peptide/nickel transport system permease protein